MNLGVHTVLRDFSEVTKKACEDKLKMLFREKKALLPVKLKSLNDMQKWQIIRSHMDGRFVKLQAHLVAAGRTQNGMLYSDYSSPAAKMRSVVTCLKLAAVNNWDCIKGDISGAFLCAKIDENEEVFLQLDRKMTELAVGWMPEL
jgi:hypothetical protein